MRGQETKFTPGPWAVGTRNLRLERGGVEQEVTQIDVCATEKDFETDQLCGPPTICRMLGNGPDWQEGLPLANAHLITAAPDMYAAGEPIAALAENFTGPDDALISVSAGELRALGAALAKARGE